MNTVKYVIVFALAALVGYAASLIFPKQQAAEVSDAPARDGLGDVVIDVGAGDVAERVEFKRVEEVPQSEAPALEQPLTRAEGMTDETYAKVLEDYEHLKDVIANEPYDFNAWLSIGTYRNIVHDYEGAIAAWEYAALIRPTAAAPLTNIASVYMYSGVYSDYSVPEGYLLRAKELLPGRPDVYVQLFELYRNFYTAKSSLAEGVLREGLEKSEVDKLTLHVMLSRYLRDEGRYSEALAQYDVAIGLLPTGDYKAQLLDERAAVAAKL